jgi:uncharacterized protein (TIGR02246 family)
MFRTGFWLLLCVSFLGLLTAPQEKGKLTTPPAAEDKAASVQVFLKHYIEVFNKNEADALANLWAADCVYVDRETGARSEGRAAIKEDLERAFKDNQGSKLNVEVSNIRFVRPDVATLDGKATVFYPNAEPVTTEFSTILVKEADHWLINNVQETELKTPTSSSTALRDLEWLLGDWVDDTPGIKVECSVQWAANRSFLVRSYKVDKDNQEPWEGTQVIGWDPRNKEIRSWTFDSDGSFDEGSWSKHGDTWNVVLSRTLEDGSIATGTQVMKKINADSYTVQMVAREIAGEPIPSSEAIKVVRAFKKPVEPK